MVVQNTCLQKKWSQFLVQKNSLQKRIKFVIQIYFLSLVIFLALISYAFFKFI